MRIVRAGFGTERPELARFEGLEGVIEIAARWVNQRADPSVEFPGGIDMHTPGGVAEHPLEVGVIIKFSLEQEERRGRTFLAGMTERGVDHVLDRKFAIGQRGDDRGVFATGLGEEAELRFDTEQAHRGGCAARENDP